ncbi:MAG: hypothetical protein ACOX6H_01425 [Christensenellales bacterium]|jgi:rRNA maturation endonuclease Nob1
MEYGIKMIEKNVFCANCGRLISTTGSYEANFCSVCGNPLKVQAIEILENEIAKRTAK